MFINKKFLTNDEYRAILQTQERSDGMNWNEDKSISLSQGCVCAFALLLAGLDGFGYWLLQLFSEMKGR